MPALFAMAGIANVGALSLFWSGAIVAICLEARVKFNAKLLTRPAAFDVGRHVFGAFSKMEMGICALGWGLVAYHRPSVPVMAAFGVATAAHLLQVSVFGPRLYRHAASIISAAESGAAPPVLSKKPHIAYVALEGVKLIALVTCAGFFF